MSGIGHVCGRANHISICWLYEHAAVLPIHGGSKSTCHIFHIFFKNGVDSFVGWGLYTGTTRAGRRWRLLNAP
jgi:hypothetical protein